MRGLLHIGLLALLAGASVAGEPGCAVAEARQVSSSGSNSAALPLATRDIQAVGVEGGAARATAGPKDQHGSTTLFVQVGRLLADPATGRVETNKTVVIQNGRVQEIRDGFVGEGQIIDLRDRFVLPGLIDTHVHLTYPDPRQLAMSMITQSSAGKAILGAANAYKTLIAGFTTVANTGAPEQDAINAVRDGIEKGEIPGRPERVAGRTAGES